MTTTEPFVTPKFDGHYDHWSMLMENFLRSKEMWNLVHEGIPSPAVGISPASEMQRKGVEEAKLKDLKVKNFLFQAIDREILETILDKSTSKAIWDSMKQKYQGSTKVKRAQLQALRKEFEMLNMKEGEKIDSFIARTLTVVNKMKVNGENVQPSTVVCKILRSLTPKFNYVVCSIEESNDLDTMTMDELHGSLLVQEQRMQGCLEEEQALRVSYNDKPGRGRGRDSFRGGRGKDSFQGGRGRGRGRSYQNKATIECFKCHQLGHYQYECPDWEKQANYAENVEEEELLLMSYVDFSQTKGEEAWFLDSGCSNHMTGNKEWFSELDEGFKQTVKLGNDTRMAVVAKGSVRFQVNGMTQVISNVFYIPELKSNLLSIGQLQEKGLAILIEQGTCKIYHPKRGLIIRTNMSRNRMFYLLASIEPTKNSMCLQAEALSEKESHLWHCRFGHLSYTGLRTLAYNKMVNGVPLLKVLERLCEVCLVGKQHRESIPRHSSWRASKQLQLVHSDICGPITPASNSNKRYILSFIDDFSRKTWVYFLHEKSEAFVAFKNFKACVEKEISAYITCLRTDRGGEFNSNEFVEFCKTHGISRQLTAAYTPQQNGVAERKNRTIMNTVRSMLAEKKIPKMFWPEAVKWCVHIQNRSPTVAVKEKTPEEAWSGVKPTVNYFRIFGCIAHVHIPDQKRSKLDSKSKKCVLLGVSDESKAYRLYDPITKKIIISNDVLFEEEESWDWERAEEELKLDVLEDDIERIVEHAEEENIENISGSSSSSDNLPSTDVNTEGVSVEGRGKRIRKEPVWMVDYETGEELSEEVDMHAMMVATSDDPFLFEEAVKSKKWREAMTTEIEAIEKNKTWELVDLPKGAKPIGVKWVFKTKLNENGDVEKHKARLVAKGYAQRYGVDYTEVFAPVARLDTIRVILAVAAHCGWQVFQLDVKSAFLHGDIKEEVFVHQPEGFIKEGEEGRFYKLKKALYGLKQAPRAWYSKIEAHFLREGFEKCSSEHTLFTKSKGGKILIVSLYVDDLIFTGSDMNMCNEFKRSMMLEFDMSDLGKMRHFLGIEVLQNSNGIFICQRRYAREVLVRFEMASSNPVKNPIVPGTKLSKDEGGTKVDATLFKQAVGSLMYLTVTRPDLMYVVSLISRYMSRPTMSHWLAAKRILRYVKGTTELGIFYKKGEGSLKLLAFTDSGYAGDLDDRRSTSGYVFMIGSGAVSWSSKKQPVVTLSTTEAEYIAAALCACQCLWLKRIMGKIGMEKDEATIIQCDSSSAIQLARNPVFHGKSKHIQVRFHFLRDLVNDGVVDLRFCNSQEQVADLMTKPIKLEQFEKLRGMIGMVNASEVS